MRPAKSRGLRPVLPPGSALASSVRWQSAIAVVPAAAAALVLCGIAAPAAQAGDPGIRDLTGHEKRAFFTSVGWTGALKCELVGVSRSNPRWAIATPSQSCGPNSGHSSVYRLTKSGHGQHWEYLFYDMELDGCARYGMPRAVRADFSPYVC